MSKLEKYPSYKESGVEWLGEIPEGWDLKPIKYLKKNIKNAFVDGPFGSSLKTEHFIQDGQVYVVESGFITTGKFKYKDFKTITEKHFKTIERSSCTENDVIIAKIGANYGMAGELPKLDKKSVVSGNSLKITLDNKIILNSVFVKLLESVKRLGGYNGIVNISAQPALSLVTLNNLRLPLPPKEEQTLIASFLDEKTAQIDEAISQKEKLIKLLKERKQIVINDAVTKGLDKAVEFVDSGVEWIGEIPKGWEVFPGLRVFSENKRKNTGMIDDRVLSLSYGRIIRKPKEKLVGLVPESFETYQIVKAGDIIIRCTDLQNDKVSLRTALAKDDGIITSAYLNLNVKDGNSEYLHYLLHVLDITKAIYKLGSGLRQNLSFVDFKRLDIVLPPKNEQLQIVQHIKTQTTKIDKAIELQQNYIAKLKEYKASLIDSVVTGKVRVV